MKKIRIKEKSFIAWVAAKVLNADQMAMVLGKTIHLHNTSMEEFLADKRWFNHELKHIEQFEQHGFFPFLFKYTIESIKNGYQNNKYEIEARQAE
ncbi:DUF4157 domain-containing protein [Gynurincola endophyticus]|uniref:DUF4157 domain-containing protein n=1 Tax=Gynurincola endophyticus TaxID=2479004 RepID=UPI000F8E8FA1|nr:DUF4157 domain-containing protein [Gynurincola endophyticus]